MRKRFISVAIVATVIASMTMSSCIGSFALTNKLLSWNREIDNKFVNELVFIAFWILPVYEVSAIADILVLNSVEFWSGTSPLASESTIIEGHDGKYLVERDTKGYTITSLNDNTKTRLDFDCDTQTWSLVGQEGEIYPLVTFVDDNYLKVNTGNGNMMLVERSQEGLYAYQQAVSPTLKLVAQE